MRRGQGGGLLGGGILTAAIVTGMLAALAGCDDSSDDDDQSAGTGGQSAAAGQGGGNSGSGSGGVAGLGGRGAGAGGTQPADGGTSGRAGAGGSSGGSAGGGAGRANGGSAGSSAGNAGDGASGGEPSPPSELRPECPESVPTNGAQCSDDNVQCQYGDDPRRECRPVATCKAGFWSITPIVASKCPEPADATCPASMAELDDLRCTPGTGANTGPYCQYENVTCGCDESTCNATDCGWFCPAPPDDPDCPWGQPNVGTSCATAGLICTYTTCQDHSCVGGYWTAADNGSCPPTPER